MPLVPLIALGTIVFNFVNVLKYATSRNWNGVLTQCIAWTAGIVGVFLAGATEFASGIAVGDVALADLNTPSKVFLGLVATSLLSTFNEFKKAIDSNDSAATPALIPSADKAPCA